MINLKEKVDIYVHEQFGNSRRLCEEDKKDIRKFLYKQLKSLSADDVANNHNTRRDSIESDISVELPGLEDINQNQLNEKDTNENQLNEKDIENRVLQRVLSLLSGEQNVDITIEAIESKVHDMNKQVENLQNEIKDCFGVLGLDNCEYSLHEVLETYTEKRQCEVAEFSKIRDRLDTLERQRHKLEGKLKAKERELQQNINNLANAEHENEKSRALMKELKAKCEKLEEIQIKHVEKQKTLMTLKSMVQELSPIHRHKDSFRYPSGSDEVDGNTLQLPKLSPPRASRPCRQSRKSGYRERSSSNHHELPKPHVQTSGYPWKY